MTKLNLGCGDDYKDGWTNVDIDIDVTADVHADVGQTPWPWETNSIDRIRARHVFEHLESVPWGELVRVLKPSGILKWTYPLGHARFEDHQHRQFWGYHTAEQITGERKHGHEGIGLNLIGSTVSWEIHEPLAKAYTLYRLWTRGPGPWLEQIPGMCGEMHAVYEVNDGK